MDDIYSALKEAMPELTDEDIRQQIDDLKSQGITDQQLRDDIIPAAIRGAPAVTGAGARGGAAPSPMQPMAYDEELEMKKRQAVRAAVEKSMAGRPAGPEMNPFEFGAMASAAFGDPRAAAAGRPTNNFEAAPAQARKRYEDTTAREKAIDEATEKELTRKALIERAGIKSQTQATAIGPDSKYAEVLRGLIVQRNPKMSPEEKEALKTLGGKELGAMLADMKAKDQAEATAGYRNRNYDLSQASREDTARGQFQTQNKDFFDIHNSFQRVKDAAKDPSPAGDLALIYNYMKMLDPGSVVREAEFAQAAKAGSLPEQIQGAASTVVSGQRLAPGVRSDFVKRARSLYTGQRKIYESTIEEAKKVAKQGGLNPERVTIFKPSIADEETPGAGGAGDIDAKLEAVRKRKAELLAQKDK